MALNGLTFLHAVALVTATSCAVTATAEVTMSPDQLRNAAIQTVNAGNPARALDFADALLARDAGDFKAQLVRARALRDLGKSKDAVAAARVAWKMAAAPSEKYSSALMMAQTLSSAGHKTRAQLWLRRAAEHAPNAATRKRAEQHFNFVRQRNPLRTQLSITLAPNTNINNGSARESSELNYAISEILFGGPVEYALSGEAQALSGLEYGFGVSTRYRIKQTPTQAHDLNFGLSYRSFSLSSSAKDAAPAALGSDFAYGTVSLGYGYNQINLDKKGEFLGGLELGQSWYGGARYASFLRGGMSQSVTTTARQKLQFAVDLEKQIGQRTADVDRAELSVGLTQSLASGNLAFVSLGATATRSDYTEAEYNEVELRGAYVMQKPVMGAALQFGLGAAMRDYDRSRHSADGRQDTRIFADVTATFTQIDYYGFNPSATLRASTTDSNIGLFDVNRVGLSLGIKSAF